MAGPPTPEVSPKPPVSGSGTGWSTINGNAGRRGYDASGECIQVGEWPVQFIPTFSELTAEAARTAETGDVDGAPLRVVRADYLAVIALSVGRAKDLARVLALREAQAVTDEEIAALADRHGLAAAWSTFPERFGEK